MDRHVRNQPRPRDAASYAPAASTKNRPYFLLACAGFASIFGTFYLMREAHGSNSDCAKDTAAVRALTDRVRRTADTIKELKEQKSPSDGAAVNASLLDSIEKALAQLDKEKRGRSSSSAAAAAATTRSEVAAGSAAQPPSGVWLRLALVTMARKSDADYLLRALHSIFEQLPAQSDHPLRLSTDVVVVNNNEPPEKHHVFHTASQMHSHRAKFVNKVILDPPLDCPSRSRKSGLRLGPPPKAAVQKQSCDLVGAFKALLDVQPPASHLVLLEDDWLLCPHGLRAIHHAVDKSYLYDPKWLALRVSYGFNGIVVRQPDLPSLTAHLQLHFARRPPDHLLFEWFSGERQDTKCANRRRHTASHVHTRTRHDTHAHAQGTLAQ